MRILGRDLGLDEGRKREVYRDIAEMSTPRSSYYIMTGLSATIATFGLLANSTAVVIGAMLMAPLMGPIFGITLALLIGDTRLLRRAMIAEVLGVAMAVMLGVLIGVLPLRMNLGSEILARVQPTLYDMLIALGSGIAGAYAGANPRVSATLPGIAMSVAIVPALATSGICLAAGRGEGAFGAFVLFLANFLAIQVAAATVFLVYGIVKEEREAMQTHRSLGRRLRAEPRSFGARGGVHDPHTIRADRRSTPHQGLGHRAW